MAPQPDVDKPFDDPFSLVGGSWPAESESAYHIAETVADDAGASALSRAEAAEDAARQTTEGMQGKTADSVSDGYGRVASHLGAQGRNFATVSSWMADAAGKIRGAKKHIANLVSAGTSEIRDALDSELKGTPVTPSSSELTDKYRGEIASISSKLTTDLDGIGHSLAGAPGASTTPAYVRTAPTATAPTIQEAAHQEASGQNPVVEPHQLPEMPRAGTPTTESTSMPGTPTAPVTTHAVNPTLSNLISGGQSASPSGSPAPPSTKSPSTPTSGTPAGQQQGHQANEQNQTPKTTGLPRIPSIPPPNIPAAATSIATAVSSATAQQLPTAAPSAPGSSLPASTGLTPGTSGTAPATPTAPAGLSPVGGLPTPPVVQPAPPVAQASPASPTPGVQAPSAPQQSPAPAAPRGPVADLAWLQRTYGLSPSLDLPRPDTTSVPALFIAGLPEDEAHLHRTLATLRHQFEQSNWPQPLAVGLIRRGLETRCVYATADALSIHPAGILLPHGVIPLDEMPGTPATSELSGSLMVTEKLTSMIPRGWEVEGMLSTVPGGEDGQSTEQYQALVEGGELLVGKVSRGQDDVGADEALSLFARAAIGSGGVGELDAEAARIRAARWVGVQSQGYLDTLSRWYLADAAESMSRGLWADAVWASEKYMSLNQSRSQVA